MINLSSEAAGIQYLLLFIVVLAPLKNKVNGEQCNCSEPVYLLVWKEGRISCQSTRQFQQVSWYTKEDYNAGTKSPFIYFNSFTNLTAGSNRQGHYIELNGSLFIENVTLSLNQCYVVEFAFPGGIPPCTYQPCPTVIVPPVPTYPVINKHFNQQYAFLNAKRKGRLHCSMSGVHPWINLSFIKGESLPSGALSLQLIDQDSSENEDGTFDVSITATYRALLSSHSSKVQCRVTGDISPYLPAVTTVELTYPPAQPDISGRAIYMEASRTGQLHCFKNNVSPKRNLVWQVSDEAFREKIIFQSVVNRSLNNDGTVNISLSSSYNVKDESIDRVTMKCILLSGSDEDSFEPESTVKLLFPSVNIVCSNSSVTEVIQTYGVKITKAVLGLLIIFSVIILLLLTGVLYILKWTNDALQAMKNDLRNIQLQLSRRDESRERVEGEVLL